MMLTNNKYERYQQNMPGNMATALGSSSSSSLPTTCGSMLELSNSRERERESIHSGQFMVSHFEAEEAQDDLDDSEVKMLDPEDPSLSKPDEPNTCTEVQLFVPRKVALLQQQGYVNTGVGLVTSHLEIETSLTKLFKCMNLAYSQKLTSPKWNHFKGVRLRWKDKIRLNNVIWRCWHMQFILKRRTPVCQFASPLDVDVHSNPQTVVLEGKYWKRQLAVIKAEYRKWRRHFKSKVSGYLTYDTKSEFDFLEWSPLNDRSLMISDDWTSDTLFSAIDGPFPFPDSREIARGAGIADFIQPSLGPLQPNLEDIDITFADLIQATRLAPVPEEGTDDMLKNVDYNFPSMICSEQMDSANIMDGITTTSNNHNISSISANDDTNMMDLNTPLNTMNYTDLEQQFTTRSDQKPTAINITNTFMNTVDNNQMLMNSSTNDDRIGMMLINDTGNVTATNTTSTQVQSKHYCYSSGNKSHSNITNIATLNDRQQQQNSNDFPGKSVIKGRISKNIQRPFRREPHNYDKAQPTLHQTTIYQQMLAEQQKNQHQQQTQYQQQQQQPHAHLRHTQQLQSLNNFQQQQLHFAQTQFPQTAAATTSNIVNKIEYGSGNNPSYNIDIAQQNAATGINNNLMGCRVQQNQNQQQQQQQTQQQSSSSSSSSSMLLNIKIEPPNNDVLNMFNLTAGNEIYVQNKNNSNFLSSNSFKPYPNAAVFKKSSSTGTFNIRGGPNSAYLQQDSNGQQQITNSSHGMHTTQSLPLHAHLQLHTHNASKTSQQQQQHQQQQQQQQTEQMQSATHLQPKEMFRSNSLPLNVTLLNIEAITTGNNPRLPNDSFAVPKYHAKSHKSRTRSNSVNQPIVPAINNINSNSNNSNSNSSNNQCAQIATTICSNVRGASGSFIAPSQLQSATSDPMLNSTLAQLLTANNRIAKQQSSSTSAISSSNLGPSISNVSSQMVVQRIGMPGISPTATTPQNQPSSQLMSTKAVNSNLFMSPTQSSSSTSSLVGIASIASSPNSAQDFIQHHHPNQKQRLHQQQQQQQQSQTKSPKKSTSLPAAAPSSSILQSPPQSKTLSYPLTGNAQTTISHLSLSPESFHEQDSPLSPTHSLKFPRDNQRRAGHIHAEQKRRYNIKNGFDLLHSLIPQLQQNPNSKLSKAAMLQKGADHIRQLCFERNNLKDKMEMLRQERDALNNSLTHLHSILPANGAPVTRQGTEHVRQMYEQYVRYCTMSNWKFWILGLILEPMLTSYTSTVSSASMEEMRRTAFLWVDQHCSLIDLRPAVSNKLKYLSMKTDILSDPPSPLQEEVIKAAKNSIGQHPNLHGT